VSALLLAQDYSLQANRKTQEGSAHPDRNDMNKIERKQLTPTLLYTQTHERDRLTAALVIA
jgi:hypothetical protein